MPPHFGECVEVRLDINRDVNPDIVASISDMGEIGSFDAVYCAHTLEHAAPHEVGQALAEFRRVLKPGGVALIIVPNLEGLSPTEDVLYETAHGPITALDLFYGYRPMLAEHPHMAHRMGFTAATLEAAIRAAGFSAAHVVADQNYNLIAGAKR